MIAMRWWSFCGLVALLAGLAGADQASAQQIMGRVRSVDASGKRLVVHDVKTRRDVTVYLGEKATIELDKGKTVALSRVRPGATVTIRDAVVASSMTVGGESIGTIRSVDDQHMVLTQEGTGQSLAIDLESTTKVEPTGTATADSVDDLQPGSRVIVLRNGGATAEKIVVEHEPASILHEFWENFRHNLFKPLLLFFYMGFLVPIFRVKFEFPYVMYQALTIYLLIAIGWHGGEELSGLGAGELGSALGFMVVGFITNSIIGVIAYIGLSAMSTMRRVDKATVAGYYGSDSAGTFVTCLGVLASAGIVYQAYMPVMLAVMEIPGCLVALYLVSRLRHKGMDALGNMPEEPGYNPDAKPVAVLLDEHGHPTDAAVVNEEEMSLERMDHQESNGTVHKGGMLNAKLLHEVFLNPGLYLLFGGIIVGYISGLQGPEVTRADDSFFITLFQGVLCLFLLEMGMTASRKLRDLKTAGAGFVAFGILAPNVFATIGILVAHAYSYLTNTHFDLGSYVLFSVLCAASSYIAVPAVQRLAIPEASPTLPLAASLGLTFSYNVTVGIPIYIEIAKAVMRYLPIT